MESDYNSVGNPPENNLIWAILCTVLCCLPLGIVAIIKASKVKELWALGDHAGAEKAAADAKKYSIWGAIIAIALMIIYFIFIAIIGIGASAFQ
jgi:hypothetical protein